MAYATPQHYAQEFGLQETAQYLADEERLLTDALLRVVLAAEGEEEPAWPDETPQPEKDAALAAVARLVRKLASVSNFMDGYLRSAVTLPLAEGNANAGTLQDCCLALAREAVADDADNITEHITAIADRWRKWLRDVQAGRVKLIASDGTEVPSSAGRVRGGQAVSGFNWGSFERSRSGFSGGRP